VLVDDPEAVKVFPRRFQESFIFQSKVDIMRRWLIYFFLFLFLGDGFSPTAFGSDDILVPQIDGDFWQIAGDPDLGKYTSPNQQPVDFGIWPDFPSGIS
jgi:hypothetical protein